MNVYLYSLFCYGLTAVISFLVMGVIVLVSKIIHGRGKRIMPRQDELN